MSSLDNKIIHIDRLQNKVTDFVTKNKPIDVDNLKQLDQLLKMRDEKFNLVLQVMGMSRVRRLSMLVSVVDRIEAELYSEPRIKGATTGELMKLVQVVSDQIKDAVDFVNNSRNQGLQAGIDTDQESKELKDGKVSKETRETLRNFFSTLTRAANSKQS